MHGPHSWTDDRIDDLVAGLDRRFDAVDRHFDRVHGELREMRGEIREMRSELHSDFGALQRQLTQIGWGLVGTLVSVLIALVVAVG